MGCYERKDDESLYVRKTPALNRFLFFLQTCIAENEVDHDGLAEIKLLMPVNDKHSFHLTLSAYLDNAELQEALSSGRNEEFFSNLSLILDDDEMEKLNVDMYVDIVLGLELTEDCLCMILADPGMKVMKDISDVLTRRIIERNVTTFIETNVFDAVLASFVKLSRVQDKFTGQSYYNCVIELLHCIVNESPKEIGQCEKMLTLARLISVSLLHEDDYHKKDEISTLLKEWDVDKSIFLTKSPSMKLFKTLLRKNSDSLIQNRSENLVLKSLDSLLSLTMGSGVTRDESFNRKIAVASQTMTVSGYLGCCAYLIHILGERHYGTVYMNDFPNTLKYIGDFIQEKPKMKQDEAMGEIRSFYHFCEIMNEHGHRDIYKRDWTAKFLTFSMDEVAGTLEGHNIVETFIVNADHDLVLEYAKKICTADNSILDADESRKELILKIFTHERKSKEEIADLVTALFQNGCNDKLALAKFKTDLHMISLQLGNIEFEKEISKQILDELTVIRICLQNPNVAVTKILVQSIRTEHYRALGFAQPFFSLTVPVLDGAVEHVDFPPVLIVNCFSKVIRNLPGFPNSFYDSLYNSIEIFISQNILTDRNIYLVLKHHILKKLVANKLELAVVVGLIHVLEKLIRLITEKDLVQDIFIFVVTLKRFFSLFTNPTTFSEASKLKNVLCRIITSLSPNDMKREVSYRVSEDETVEDFSLFDQGILYVRCIKFRSLIKRLLSSGSDELSFKDFIQNCALPWIVNCNEEEWDSLIDFIFNVTMSETSKLHRVKNINKTCFLNELMLLTYAWYVERKCTEEFLHVFRFYGSAVETVKYQLQEMQWYSLFDTLLTISIEISKPYKQRKSKPSHLQEAVGLHQILSYLLSKVEEFSNGSNNIKWEQLLVKIDKFHQLDSGSEPIRWLISEKIKKLQSSCLSVTTA